MLKKSYALLSLVIFFSVVLLSVEVKKIEVGSYTSFQKGLVKGLYLNSKGGLSMSRIFKDIKGPAEEYYFSFDTDSASNIYFGTGHRGKVYKYNSVTKKTEKIYSSDQLDIYSVLVAKNGTVYIATSPNGKVYRLKDKKAIEIFNPREKMIWDMKEDHNGHIICATGNNGAVYRVRAKGDVTSIFAPEDSHISSIYITKGNSILAGSGDRGILYKIINNKVKVLYDSPYNEVKGICEDKSGNVYFAVTRDARSIKMSSGLIRKNLSGGNINKQERPKDQSALYCVNSNGVTEKIWSDKKQLVYSIVYDEVNDKVIVGTGNSGRIYSVDKNGSFKMLFESESAQIFKLKRDRKLRRTLFLTNNTAKIGELSDICSNKGEYSSQIFDLKVQSGIGRLYWDGEGIMNRIEFFVRTGNSNLPDKTWSNWSPPHKISGSDIGEKNCRYIQIKAVLNTAGLNTLPVLNNFRFYYVQDNLSPRITDFKVIKSKKIKGKPLVKSNSAVLKWKATDGNGDKLKFEVLLKKNKNKKWISIKENLSVNKFVIEPEMFEDGLYKVKVIGDDSFSNPDNKYKKATYISDTIILDSTAPEIIDFVNYKTGELGFKVKDKVSIIKSVLYSLDGKYWHPVFPVDNISDSVLEAYRFKPAGRGERVIFIKVSDRSENRKVYQKVII